MAPITRRDGPGCHPETASNTSLTTDISSLPRPNDTTLPNSVPNWWVPEPDTSNWWGVLFSAFAARGVIEGTGTAILGQRKDGRLAPVRLWVGTVEFRRRQRGDGR